MQKTLLFLVSANISFQKNKNDQKEVFFVCTKKNLKNFFASTIKKKKHFRERFRDGGFFFYPQKKFWSKSSQEFFLAFAARKYFLWRKSWTKMSQSSWLDVLWIQSLVMPSQEFLTIQEQLHAIHAIARIATKNVLFVLNYMSWESRNPSLDF